MKTVIVIPARLASTRLPRKLLLDETGQTLLQHTYEAASRCQRVDRVIVAADSQEIAQAVQAFGGEVMMTDPKHTCGTDRVAEVARSLECDVIVNVQGDEPEIDPRSIDLVIDLLADTPKADVATVATPIRNRDLLEDPACVKVVRDDGQFAMYFSRSVIPHPRRWEDGLLQQSPALFWQHVGLYAYRRPFLLEAPALPVAAIESTESLEQLRWLHAGYAIRVGEVAQAAPGIDTPNDYAAFVSRQCY